MHSGLAFGVNDEYEACRAVLERGRVGLLMRAYRGPWYATKTCIACGGSWQCGVP